MFSSAFISDLASICWIFVVFSGAVWFLVRLDGRVTTLQADAKRVHEEYTRAQAEFTSAHAQVSGRMYFVEGLAVAILMTAIFPVKILMDFLITNQSPGAAKSHDVGSG